jgi:hypothetical protein
MMKRLLKHIVRADVAGFFVLGILLSIAAQNFYGCPKSDNPVSDDENNQPQVDVGAINNGASSAEQALLSGDTSQVRQIFTPESQTYYAPILAQIPQSRLTALGNAMKNRTLKIYSELYAEYEFSENGNTYTVALARQDDGSWKIVRM